MEWVKAFFCFILITSTKIVLETVKEDGKKIHINFYEKVISEINLTIETKWIYTQLMLLMLK